MPDHLARYDAAIVELMAAYDEWATCWEAEKTEHASFVSQAISGGMSPSAADTYARTHAIGLAAETIRVQQTIRALEAEIRYLTFRADHPE